MSAAVDHIMELADVMADAKAAHAQAVHLFSNDLVDYDTIPPLAAEWALAEKTLRLAVEEVCKSAT